MKKISTLITAAFLLFCETFSYANYEGYKAYLKGLIALKKGKPDIAVSEYERVLAYDGDATTVYRDLAVIYLQKGNIQKALENARKLQEIENDNVNTQIFLGSFFLSVNETLSAKQCWERVLELDPQNETATVYLAAYYYSDNKLKESIDYWTKFLEQQPESSEGYFQLGIAQERLGMPDDALKSYKKVNELRPDAQEGYLARARIYENKKEYSLAIEEYKEYAKLFSGNPSILIYLGKCYFEEKNYSQAQEVLLKAKEYVPNNISLNYLLGMVYEKQGKIDDAIDVFDFIIKTEPTSANYTRLGYYYALKQNYKSAEKQFNKALEIEPLSSEILYLSALNYIDYGKYEKAEKNLEQALYLRPDFNDAKFYLAVAYDKLDRFDKAQLLLKEILETDPDNVRALNFLGYGYADRNINLDDAETLLKKLVEIIPDDPAYMDSLAWLYYKKQNYELAEHYSLKAVNSQIKVFDKDLYEHLGDISIELNKLSQAWLAYAVAYDIGSSTAKKKMSLLKNKISQTELAKLQAERAVFNFNRIAALKAGYKLKINYAGAKNSSFLSVLFARRLGLKFDLAPKLSFQGMSVFFNEDKMEFFPQAMKNSLSKDILLMFDFANVVFSKNFINLLLASDFEFKGNTITYTNSVFSVKIDAKEGTFKKFRKKDSFELLINSYRKFNKISKIPSSITFKTVDSKFKSVADINNLSVPVADDLKVFIGD